MKIELLLDVELEVDELANRIAGQLTHHVDAKKFVEAFDSAVADWDFTKNVYYWYKEKYEEAVKDGVCD